MCLVDYHTHPYGHGNNDYGFSLLKNFINKAKNKNLKVIGFSDHNYFAEEINWENMIYLKNKVNFDIRIGMEFDYIPGEEKNIAKIIKKFPLDYCIGSVHQLGDWVFDHPDYIDEYDKRNIDEVYTNYFKILKQAAETGLFDIIGHLDLIKVFNYRPQNKNVQDLVKPVLKTIKKENIIMEINSNGLNKPVGEIYPDKEIIKIAYDYNIPVTLGSDAHDARRVGEGLKEISFLLKKIGYKKIITNI